MLFRYRRSRSVGRAIYSERRPRQSGSRRPAPPPPPPPPGSAPLPASPPPAAQTGGRKGHSSGVFTAETCRSPPPRSPSPRQGWEAAGGGCCRCPHREGGRGARPGGPAEPRFSSQRLGNATLRACCCLSVPHPERTARGGRRWPPRGWGARPSGRWSGCSWPERQNALLLAGTRGRSPTPA